ncbi:MAG: hypothetical protein J5994_04080 [Ruminococcus sp.]|nr:hypothetical protein [Ruminococcus sp.]
MKRFHPAVRLLMLCCVLIPTMFCRSLFAAAVSFLGAAAALFLLKPAGAAAREITLAAGITLLSTVLNPLFSHRGVTPLFLINGRPYTLEALVYGADMGLSIAAVIMWISLGGRLISKGDMLYLFGRFSPKLALVVSMTTGCIPKLGHKIGEISRAQKGTGLFSGESRADRLRFGAGVFSAAAAWSAENAAETSAVMLSRGYGYAPRTCGTEHRLRRRDIFAVSAASALFAAVLILFAFSDQAWDFYPVISPPQGRFACPFKAAFFASAFEIPFILAKERLKWRYLTAKI